MKLNYKECQVKLGKKGEEPAQRGRIKPWVICGQDWTVAPERFGHGSVYTELQRKDSKRPEETLNSYEPPAVSHTSPLQADVHTEAEEDTNTQINGSIAREKDKRLEINEEKVEFLWYIIAW